MVIYSHFIVDLPFLEMMMFNSYVNVYQRFFMKRMGTKKIIRVGGIPTPLKHMKVSWDPYSQYTEK